MSPTKRDSGYCDGNLEPIAIVGMACRLGEGVNSPAAMWDAMLKRELKTAARVPESRFNIDAYLHPGAFTRPSSITSPGGAFIDTAPEHFDPEFFGMEEDEAMQTDPQHRRMLELVYECLESAGITKDAVVGSRTGVYVGNFNLDAVVKSCRHEYDRHAHATMSIDPGLVSSRISFWFDLKGPVFTINTGGTSVFFATDTACLALRAGDCDAAIIGGVNMLQSPEQSISISKYGVLSPDSVPLPFDSGAKGYLRAEGVGAIYVKRLSDAIRDRDPIRGVIRCTQTNSNGAQPGLPMFTPNRIYKKAGLDPNDTAYVEPQGIGLPFADVSEQIGIGSAMKATRSKESPVLMGSLKGNFGHQEAASGVFALIKAAMMTEAGVIPGLPNFKNYHSKVDPDGLNIKVQTETIAWPEQYATRRVAFSSWGWSGTNGHVLVEALDTSLCPECQQAKTRHHKDYDHSLTRPLLVIYSAHTRSALRKNIEKHQGLVDKCYLADLAYTLNMRRTRFNERAFAVVSEGSNPEEWTLSSMTFGSAPKDGRQPSVAFMLPDPSTMLVTDMSDWLKYSPTMLQKIKRLGEIFTRLGRKTGLEDVIQKMSDTTTTTKDRMPHLVGAAMQIAIVDVLAEWNIHPTASFAHQGGEALAAYSSGHLSAPEALFLLDCAARGQDPYSKADFLNTEELAWRRPRTAVASLVIGDTLDNLLSQNTRGRCLTNGNRNSFLESPEDIQVDTIIEIGKSDVLPKQTKTLHERTDVLLQSRSKAASFSEALKAVGTLHVLGCPVDLEQAKAVHDVDWKPMLLVDPPPYQWDHGRCLMVESHAFREERLWGVPYHELLGRRVHGLSPRSMIWKNPFVQENVPWLYGSKPTATLSAALCLSLVIEALTQASQSGKHPEFTLHDFVFPSPLPPTKTDEILELQTCIQPTRSREVQRETFLVAIESVRDGRWTTHCEGTAVVSAGSDSALTLQQGKSDVEKANGTHGRTTSMSNGITGDDSDPYRLHPLTIYGCLQHALASAASGKPHSNAGYNSGVHGSGSKDGLKIAQVEKLRGVWNKEERMSGPSWTVSSIRRDATHWGRVGD